jgi:hypothetical protein
VRALSRWFSLLPLLFAAALLAGSYTVPRAVVKTEPSPLTDLAWLAGYWAQEGSGDHLDEYWSPPIGNSMVGHFRWVRGDSLWITEHMSITQEEDGVVFRLRHFSNRMRGWELADDPFVYRLVERAGRRAVFRIAEPRPDRPDEFRFQALTGDSLLVRLKSVQGGETVIQDFRFRASRSR